jgi:outer membrane protein assembly factor BamB
VPPTVADGRVLVRTADNQLYALEPATGEILWRHSGLFEQAGLLGGAPPAYESGIVVVAYSSGEVFGLRVETGRPLWSETVLRPRRIYAIEAISDIVGAPVIDRGRVDVAGSGGEMVALELQTGSRVWDLALTSIQTPWAAGEFLFVVTERGELVCLLRQGGRIRWVSPLDPPAEEGQIRSGTIWTGPLLVSDRLLVAGSSGEIASVSPYTGEIIGKAPAGGAVSQPPVVAEGTVFVLTDGGDLVAFR